MLVFQRYGRGKAFAFLPQDSWLWQMHAIDCRRGPDARELLAAAAALAGRRRARSGRAVVHHRARRAGRSRHADRERRRSVVRRAERRRGDGHRHRRPTAAIVDVPMSWDGEHPGEYSAAIPTKAPGWYEARIDATRAGKSVGSAVTHFRAAPGDAEYFDATMHAGTLRRIAEETGGRFYDAANTTSARRRSALHRPRRDHGRRARAVAHADRADAAGRPAVRGMGVSACRRPGVMRLAAVVLIAGVRSRALGARRLVRPRATADAGDRLSRDGRVRRPLRVRAAALRRRRDLAAGRLIPPRAAVGARLPARRSQLPEDPERAHVRHGRSSTRATSSRSTIPIWRCFPMAYMSEPGFWTMNDAEMAGLRGYLKKGGFVIFDDFRGDHMYNLIAQMRSVLPEATWQRLDATHPIFHSFFEINSLDDVPGLLRDPGVARHLRGQRPDESACWRSPTTTTISASSGSSRTPATCRSICRTRRTSSA